MQTLENGFKTNGVKQLSDKERYYHTTMCGQRYAWESRYYIEVTGDDNSVETIEFPELTEQLYDIFDYTKYDDKFIYYVLYLEDKNGKWSKHEFYTVMNARRYLSKYPIEIVSDLNALHEHSNGSKMSRLELFCKVVPLPIINDVMGDIQMCFTLNPKAKDNPHGFKWQIVSERNTLIGSTMTIKETLEAPLLDVVHEDGVYWIVDADQNGLVPPRKVRKLKIDNCASCAYRTVSEEEYGFVEMVCARNDENPWGDEADIHYTVCNGFKASR